MNPWQRWLGLFLRVGGVICMTAIVAVFMPRGWIDRCHQALGLGPFPVAPIAEYLARSASLLYAVLGVVLWVLGGGVERSGAAIRGVALGMLLGGPVLLTIDLRSGLPGWWIAMEGPMVVLLGAVILLLQAKSRQGQW
jgi:hypothetical protein